MNQNLDNGSFQCYMSICKQIINFADILDVETIDYSLHYTKLHVH